LKKFGFHTIGDDADKELLVYAKDLGPPLIAIRNLFHVRPAVPALITWLCKITTGLLPELVRGHGQAHRLKLKGKGFPAQAIWKFLVKLVESGIQRCDMHLFRSFPELDGS
jgi:hypothetical protein